MSASKRPRGPAHEWVSVTPRLSRWWFFAGSRRAGESELLEGPGPVTGYSQECARCGCVRLFAPFYDDGGRRRVVELFGLDFDSLTPARGVACEALARPLEAVELAPVAPAAGRHLETGAAA